jgi:hypothetical protein
MGYRFDRGSVGHWRACAWQRIKLDQSAQLN